MMVGGLKHPILPFTPESDALQLSHTDLFVQSNNLFPRFGLKIGIKIIRRHFIYYFYTSDNLKISSQISFKWTS